MRSSETPHCPHCGRILRAVGSRKRTLRDTDGSKLKLIVRRLFCEYCHRIHHELPDLIVPYKRHCADTIEEILSDKDSDTYPCETSTAVRLRHWFSLLRGYWERALIALRHLYENDEQILADLSMFIPFQPALFSAGWLKKIVRILVNAGFWIQTRLA